MITAFAGMVEAWMVVNWPELETWGAVTACWTTGLAFLAFLFALVLKRVELTWVGRGLMGAGLLGALVTLVARALVAQHAPWSNLWESMVTLLFWVLVFYFVTEIWYRPRHFGLIASPLAFLTIASASMLPAGFKGTAPLMPALQSYWIKIHVVIIISSYAAFTMAFAAALGYFFFRWRAGSQAFVSAGGPEVSHATDFSAQMAFFDELTYRLILLGFPLLMVGIITGAMWANSAWGTYWSWDPKETWSLITWFVYAAYLHARITHDLAGAKACGLAVLGFVAMLITYIGVNYLSSGLHSYGFIR
jgi:cytochrome c-type biogenesis protein CcsB